MLNLALSLACGFVFLWVSGQTLTPFEFTILAVCLCVLFEVHDCRELLEEQNNEQSDERNEA